MSAFAGTVLIILLILVVALVVACIFMYEALCLAEKELEEFASLLRFVSDNHQFMPGALLEHIQKFR